jgi:ribosomal protein S6
MREYELFYLVGESKETALDAIRAEVEDICREEGAEFLTPETSDKRKLAYEVQGETRGIYVARRFTLPDTSDLSFEEYEAAMAKGDAVARINRKLALSKNILRVLVLRADGLPELKPIERTEYVRRDTRDKRGRRERVVAPAPAAPMSVPTEAEKKVSKEEIDAQLKEKLDI